MLDKSTLSTKGCSWEWANSPTQNTCPLPFIRPLSCCGRSESGEKSVKWIMCRCNQPCVLAQRSVQNALHLKVHWLSSFLSSQIPVLRGHQLRGPPVPRRCAFCSQPKLGAAAVSRAALVPAARTGGKGALPMGRSFAKRWRPASLSPGSLLSQTAARPRHGECALRGEALPQLPAAAPGASLDRGFSGRAARPSAGTTSRPRVSPPSCTRPAGLSPCYVTSAPHGPSCSSLRCGASSFTRFPNISLL